MYIGISQLKDHSLSVDQAKYATSVIKDYLDTSTIKENPKFHKTTLPHDMILTKEYASISGEKVGVLSIE